MIQNCHCQKSVGVELNRKMEYHFALWPVYEKKIIILVQKILFLSLDFNFSEKL